MKKKGERKYPMLQSRISDARAGDIWSEGDRTMNIFVVIGTAEMDELIEAIDEQVEVGFISKKHKIVAQIGRGLYKPKNMRFFGLVSTKIMQKGFDWADLVINTGGMATISDTIIKRKKKMICVWMRPWSPQLVKPWVDGNHILYTDYLEDLHLLIQEAEVFDFKPYAAQPFRTDKILELLEKEQ